MQRIFFSFLGILLLLFFYFQIMKNEKIEDIPIFLKTDAVAQNHNSKIELTIHSRYKPDSFQIEILKNDYNNLWAHLNNLYQTNDVQAGKEYYTEPWFKSISGNYKGETPKTGIVRKDIKHHLHVQNWSTDGLVCIAIDSNVILSYTYPDSTTIIKQVNIAIVLLYQGDHWRIDAMNLMDETPIVSSRKSIRKKSLIENILEI